MGPFAVPWLGSVTPLLVESGAQFGEPGPPPELKSGGYAKEFNEVKALGSAASTQRTTEQTNIAKFYSGNAWFSCGTARPGDRGNSTSSMRRACSEQSI